MHDSDKYTDYEILNIDIVSGKNQLVGDMLCLGGAVLFAIVTVLQELSVKNTDIVEYLGLLGLFGSIISGVQMWVQEIAIIIFSKLNNALKIWF